MKKILFILLAVSTAISACRDAEPVITGPIETGVRISVGHGERTVVPDVSGLYYTLDLTTTGKEPVVEVIAESETSKTVNLTPGVWSLDIEGYLCETDAEDGQVTPVVRGNVGNITVLGGNITDVTVPLEAAEPSAGKGALDYEVYFPASVDNAELTLTLYGGGVDIVYDLTLGYGEGGNIGSIELDAGYYRLAIALDDGDKQVRQRDIVHIVDKLATTAVYTYTADSFAEPQEEGDEGDDPLALGVNILDYDGWFNAAYITWEPLDAAETYEVHYKKSNESAYVKADAPLIRNYGAYYRADVMGIVAGSYDLKVRPVFDEEAQIIALDEERVVNVQSHDRSGYAFANNKVPGAYTMDGAPKPNARIIYVTDQNKDTISLGVNVDGKGDKTQTGIQNILDGHKKGNESRPLIVRLIGQIKSGTWTSSYAGDMMFETKNDTDTYITLEGVGEDATADGWGVRMKNASNIEISNIGFMNTAASEGDDVGLQQKNYYIWVHNCDLFYGKAGGDSDQAKGDGAMDAKGSTYVTFSYNHFWDNGKTHLLGNKETGPDGGAGLLTLHHNWYDHSDSRHPRVRVHQVHVYNNYYDGIAKYGVGAAVDSTIFVESNYFRATKYPMLISMQGSDVWDGAKQQNDYTNKPTFSKEDGGFIKAYNNSIDTTVSSFRFVAYGASGYPAAVDTTVDFDAYVVENRNDTVPSSVKADKGGHTYNNFDTAAGFYTYTADTPEQAKDKVIQYAGRMGGGDFKWTFTQADDSSSDVNKALQTALTSYTTTLVSAQGGNGGGEGGSGESGGGTGEGGGGTGEGGGGISEDSITCDFTGRANSNPAVFTITGNYSNGKGSATVNGTSYTDCLKMESSTNISFTTTETMTLTLYFENQKSPETGKKVKIDGDNQTTDTNAKVTVSLAAGSHTITKGDGINLFFIELTK
ncbi:MAG: hypothetical protein LBL06_01035 [Treponema sp.]|nr:hypothetical protein [Treponema sp.]